VNAREAILARIATALADRPTPPSVPRDYRTTTLPDIDIVERFAERVGDYRADVWMTTAGELPSVVASALASRGARRIVIPVGLPDAWLPNGDFTWLGDDPPLTHAELDAVDATVTSCAIAIAETGTIVLDAGPGQGRRALTLLPDVHVCIVSADRIVGDVPEAIARLDARRPLTWISGPSATSDIELNRIEGVHGPRKLDVVIVSDRPRGARTPRPGSRAP
jgi:L-lactate dehydrogenase complex protein LldG